MSTEKRYAEYGQRLANARMSADLMQKDVAKHLGVKDNIISYFENGDRIPNIEQFVKLAKLFNVSADYLLGLSEAPTTDKDIQFVCDYTGITQKNVQALHKVKKNNENILPLMNEILSPQMTTFSLFLTEYQESIEGIKHCDEELTSLWETAIKKAKYKNISNSDCVVKDEFTGKPYIKLLSADSIFDRGEKLLKDLLIQYKLAEYSLYSTKDINAGYVEKLLFPFVREAELMFLEIQEKHINNASEFEDMLGGTVIDTLKEGDINADNNET